MAAPFQIRRAQTADAAGIARLSSELGYPASPAESLARLEALLPRPEQFIAVAAAAATLLGWIAAERRLLLESGERVEIVGLVVSPAARRAGVGRALVADVERWALEQRVGTLVVRSNVVRIESHQFYPALGYVRRKTQHTYARTLAAIPAAESG